MFTGGDTEMKTAAIGQSVVQAVCPRAVVAQLQIGLAVQLHQHFRSKYLIESLNNLSYCSSYNEALRFECNAALASGLQLDCFICDNSYIKFSADNVDNNIRTLDGQNTSWYGDDCFHI